MARSAQRPGRADPASALRRVAQDAAGCRACALWQLGTQTVFGAGPPGASLMLVGEQPGDQEDRRGEPFVGPAGRLLDDALQAAAVRREDVYVTNAVKHFKWAPRGKRRIHQKPNRTEVVACQQWLDAEVDLVDPDVIVALGATAGQALVGPSYRVGAARGQVLEAYGHPMLGTLHPSAVLRTEPGPGRDEAFAELVEALRRAGELAAS